jgi:hypothetical protein
MQSKSIRVAVIYEPERKPKPIWFDLDGEQIRIQEVCYFWQSHQGKAQLNHYSVQTEQGLYELIFNTLDQTWRVQQGHQ